MDLSSWIEHHATFTPDKAAVRFAGEAITYEELAGRIGRLAGVLARELGVGHGDRVAHLGYNSPEFLDLVFACARLGAIVVPLNWRLAAPEHLYILRNSGASVLLVEPAFHEHVDSIRDALGDCRLVRYGGTVPGWLDYRALLDAGGGAVAGGDGGFDDPLLIVYTSGTTGRPKGAVLTQSALFWNAVNATHMHDMVSTDHVLTVLPLFHVGGLNNQTLPALHLGATVTLLRRFEPGAALAAIAADRPTLTVLVPATMQAVVEHPDWAATDISCLRVVTTGSTMVPVPLIRTFQDRGVPVIQVYGSTETAPIAVYQTRADAARSIGSTGKPALHCAVRIVDDDGGDVAPGERGEILVRGPNVMREYWADPQGTAEALVDGWFHTGDIGHRDADGYFWIDERKNDVIISGSENIYPAEVEAVLAECPDFAEAAVVARPDARWGEVPVAVVVLRPGSAVDKAGVLALFEGRLAKYKHPHDVVFADILPRNAMGKVLKYQLREMVKESRGASRAAPPR